VSIFIYQERIRSYTVVEYQFDGFCKVINAGGVSFIVRKQRGSEHVMLDGINNTDAARAAVLLTSDFQCLPGTAEELPEHHLCPSLYATGDLIYLSIIPVTLE
jgi:hypothetical protein